MLTKFLQTAVAFAETIDIKPIGDKETLGALTIPKLISTGINLVMVVVGLAFFVMLVLGGLKWVVSEGDKNNVEGARNQVTNALIGLAIVFSAWAILRLVETVFGVSLLNLTIPTIK